MHQNMQLEIPKIKKNFWRGASIVYSLYYRSFGAQPGLPIPNAGSAPVAIHLIIVIFVPHLVVLDGRRCSVQKKCKTSSFQSDKDETWQDRSSSKWGSIDRVGFLMSYSQDGGHHGHHVRPLLAAAASARCPLAAVRLWRHWLAVCSTVYSFWSILHSTFVFVCNSK